MFPMNNPKVIVLLPVYRKDNPTYLHLSVESILTQTYNQLHILIGLDGPIEGSLAQTVESYSTNKRITILPFKENRGLASTLNDMILWSQEHGYTYYARMDADDISLPQRIEKQMTFLLSNPEIDVVGGATNEIDENGNDRHKINHYPLTPHECFQYFAKRSPLAHPAVIIKQSLFDKINGYYRPDYRKAQDTMLWYDGLYNGAQLANIPDVVLNFRVINDFYTRRSNGYEYAKKMLNDRKLINKNLNYGIGATIYAYLLFIFRLSPNWIIKLAYKFL